MILFTSFFFFQNLTSVLAPGQDIAIPSMLESKDTYPSSEVAADNRIRVLESIFHHRRFRGKQEDAIVILQTKNCLLVQPTGAGKTVRYAIPALIAGEVTVVVCPVPAYANLGSLTQLTCPVVAMTGTCTARTEDVILKSLNLNDATVVRQSCDRENIFLFVKNKKSDVKDQVAALILAKYSSQCGIIYCLQRSDTTDMAYLLQTKGVNATYYHRALGPYKKKILKLGRKEEPMSCVLLLRLECA